MGWLRQQWDGPFMVKGITRVDDAKAARVVPRRRPLVTVRMVAYVQIHAPSPLTVRPRGRHSSLHERNRGTS
ncbi:hypothetical protein F7P69_08455 [Cellulosimicrobium funkei]|nr:hypothetical protein [Cellulosimicrobium funkei]